MPAFRTSGSTGVAPTTVWMSYVADRYTILSPYQDNEIAINPNALNPCNFCNQFNLNHATFGAFNTAPDGTTNSSQKIVEDATTNQHYIQAGFVYQIAPFIWPILRVAGIFKAAERTRIALMVLSGITLSNFLYCGFDLSGGQIAYGAQNSGGIYTLKNQVIYPVGSGFYLCIMDFQQPIGNDPPSTYHFLLDNGSGTGAPSISYAGNGTSGLFGWRTSVLPAQAWNIAGTQSFSDEFNDPTLSEIDVNDTLAPGFKWYVRQDINNAVQNFLTQPVGIPPGSLSASGSVLTIPPSPVGTGNNVGPGVSTFGQHSSRNPLPGIGQGWAPPVMIEGRMAFDWPNLFHGGDAAFWASYIEWANAISATKIGTNGGGLNFSETGFPIGPQTSYDLFMALPNGAADIEGPPLQTSSMVGFPPFESTWTASGIYSNGCIVGSGGVFYNGNTSPITTAPPSAQWISYSYPPGRDLNILTDLAQLQLYTDIVLPYNRVTKDRGCMLHFFNGIFKTQYVTWAPYVVPGAEQANSKMHTTDWMQIFIMLTAGSGYGMSVDYVRVTQ